MSPAPLAIPPEPTTEVLGRLADAAAGRGPLLLPHSPDETPEVPEGAKIDRGVVPEGGGIAVGTSGSTGVAKRVVLPPAALAASADATHARLGGPGRWLLALPGHHIAGLQVLLRSLRAGTDPAVLPPGTFTPSSFADGVETLTGGRRYTSLVPTQLGRILDDERAVAAASSLDAVLVGGSAVQPGVLERARSMGIPLVLTYGMSETAGGCVYDGRPLDGVHLRIGRGRIHLAGDVLASGYLVSRGGQDDPFTEHGGMRWFRTDDMGHLGGDGLLVVDGRADDVIISGGLKVWPSQVERALAGSVHDGCELAVVGIPDPEWGQRVAVVVECPHAPSTDLLTALLDRARELLPPHARPKVARVVRAFPRLGPGKPDRRRLASLLMDSWWDDDPTTLSEDAHEEG